MKVLHILLLIFVLIGFANAQDSILSGTVVDLNKSPLSNTAITATNADGKIFKTISDEKGFYRLWLPFGNYTIEFHKYGFKRTLVKGDFLSPGSNTDVKMEPGVCNDCNGDPYSNEIQNVRKPDEADFSKPKEKFGILVGKAVDNSDNILSDAVLRFRNKKKEEFQTSTNGNGEYLVRLPLGSYKVIIEFEGKERSEGFKVTINKFENKNQKIIITRKNK
jgi:Carboxypeptidase regulatory-like domain